MYIQSSLYKNNTNYLFNISQLYLFLFMNHDYVFKYALVGNTAVGKSSIIRRYADDRFQDSYLATIGVDFKFKTLEIQKNIIKLQIWDTAGQQRFRTITNAYYKGSHGIFIAFDLTQESTFEDIQNFWFNEIQKHTDDSTQIFILGNKCDSQQRQISTEKAQEYCDNKGVTYFQVSAKTKVNIQQCFLTMTKNCIKKNPKSEKQELPKSAMIESLKKKREQFQVKAGQELMQIQKKKKCC